MVGLPNTPRMQTPLLLDADPLSPWMQTPLLLDADPLSPRMQTPSLPGCRPPSSWMQTLWMQDPPDAEFYPIPLQVEIRSASGRHASYWNAFLLSSQSQSLRINEPQERNDKQTKYTLSLSVSCVIILLSLSTSTT